MSDTSTTPTTDELQAEFDRLRNELAQLDFHLAHPELQLLSEPNLSDWIRRAKAARNFIVRDLNAIKKQLKSRRRRSELTNLQEQQAELRSELKALRLLGAEAQRLLTAIESGNEADLFAVRSWLRRHKAVVAQRNQPK